VTISAPAATKACAVCHDTKVVAGSLDLDCTSGTSHLVAHVTFKTCH